MSGAEVYQTFTEDLKKKWPIRRIPPSNVEPKPVERGTVEKEIESIKRTLYNAIDKLDKLTSR